MKIALIQFREVGKKYYFSIPKHIDLAIGELVVVETTEGLEIGEVYSFKNEEEIEIMQALKPVVRIANSQDIEKNIENEYLENNITINTQALANELNLKMKILDAEYTLDNQKLTIYFEAEGRIDFRELLKDLNANYSARIELRQIGPRDVAKKIGGIGPCGLILCCQSFIGEFEPITIKMAKNQSVSLNHQKISGLCGKLLCCLKYEDDLYTELKRNMPDLYSKIKTDKGEGKVIDINLLRRMVKVQYRDSELANEWIEYH
ncbi:MAG TPA: stage 0 sporulation protein [Acholeplasmataceae bacterium]|nr:stage 0 sporulation protein [Acholeplasmataceae bacterium]